MNDEQPLGGSAYRAEDWIFTAPATDEELELNRAVEQAALDHKEYAEGSPGEGWIAFADEHPPRQDDPAHLRPRHRRELDAPPTWPDVTSCGNDLVQSSPARRPALTDVAVAPDLEDDYDR